MKKPDIAKRMLPLLDIIFLLLAFFIILPHGIMTSERIEIIELREKNNQIQKELEYYSWKYSGKKAASGKIYKTMSIVLVSDKLYIDSEKIHEEKWEQEILKKIYGEKIQFVILKINDIAGKPTRSGTVERLENILKKTNVIYIIDM